MHGSAHVVVYCTVWHAAFTCLRMMRGCRENYTQVEKIFRQSSEFCNEHPTWRLNVAHVFYMQVRLLQETLARL
jgi:hypothetical protein